jgi:hypothetical protein
MVLVDPVFDNKGMLTKGISTILTLPNIPPTMYQSVQLWITTTKALGQHVD